MKQVALLLILVLFLTSTDCQRNGGKCSMNEETPAIVPCEPICIPKTVQMKCTGGAVGVSNVKQQCFCKKGFARQVDRRGACISFKQCLTTTDQQ